MQQQKLSCAGCGAELMPGARFCRKCGEAANPLGRASVTEVTTRRLGAKDEPFMPGQAVSGQPPLERRWQTGPAQAAETRGLATAPASPLKKWLPGLLILCIAIIIPALYVLRQWRQPNMPTKVVIPSVPQPPKPPPPPGAGTTTQSTIDRKFFYPGASTTMIINKAGEGERVQLSTQDSVDKVSDWYTAMLKPSEIIRQPMQTILKEGNMTVLIKPDANGASIMLIQK
jgi:hypothetical protein